MHKLTAWLKNRTKNEKAKGEEPELDSRVVIDLLFKASSCYARLDPSQKIAIGDYGSIDAKTGDFQRRGNLRVDFPDIEDWLGKPQITKQDYREFIASEIASGKGRTAIIRASTTGVQQGGEWTISSSRCVILCLINPSLCAYPNEGRLGDFLLWKTKKNPEKKAFFSGQAVVTRTYIAQSYARLLTNGHAGKAICSFKSTSPQRWPGGHKLKAAQVWEANSESGSWSTGGYSPGKYSFTPLVELRSMENSAGHPFVLPFDCSRFDFESIYPQNQDAELMTEIYRTPLTGFCGL